MASPLRLLARTVEASPLRPLALTVEASALLALLARTVEASALLALLARTVEASPLARTVEELWAQAMALPLSQLSEQAHVLWRVGMSIINLLSFYFFTYHCALA